MGKLSRRKVNALRRERSKLLEELGSLSLMLRGSYLERFSTCSHPNCRCHEGQRHGPRAYVVVTEQKRQRQHYVPKDQQKAVQRGVDQYHRLLEVLCRVTAINLELMKSRLLDEEGD